MPTSTDFGGDVMKPSHKKIEKIDKRLRIQPLRGGQPPLHYLISLYNQSINHPTSQKCCKQIRIPEIQTQNPAVIDKSQPTNVSS